MKHNQHDTSGFSCFIIGEGSLPIQCANMLLERKHRILGVISAEKELRQWAQEHHLPVYDPSHDAASASELLSLMQKQPFDYLFSIINTYIIPNEMLTLPDRYAINYHDAPLPKYAGMYATSWAIMNREVKHGISWHVMSEEIDAGDIFKQKLIDIAAHDTALTLNAKCYEAAITGFSELIDQLGHNQMTPIPQNLAERTYFSLYKRPPAGGVISWQQTAEEIDALSRALTFGPYPNALGRPKLALAQDLLIVAELQLGRSVATAPAGTIISINENGGAQNGLTVATSSGTVIIKTLLTIDGAPLSLSDVVKQYDLYVGKQLGDLSKSIADAITAQNRKIVRRESFWRQRLATLQPIEPPYRKGGVNRRSDNVATLPLSIPDEVMGVLKERNWSPNHFLFTVFAVYLSRLNDNHNDVDYFDIALVPPVRGIESFFASQIPFRVAIEADCSFDQVYKTLERERKLSVRQQTYARDMVTRYPELSLKPPLSVTVAEVEQLMAERLPDTNGLALYLDGSRWDASHDATLNQPVSGMIAYNSSLFEQDAMGRMVGHLQSLFKAVVAEPEQPINTLPLLTKAERHQLLVEWNPAEVHAKHSAIHQLFEDRVEYSPDAIALSYSEDGPNPITLTYQELNERANQLAHYLQAFGVEHNVLVGLCLERTVEMVVGILAILKAGGAYVPLDPVSPPERLAFMLDDAQMPVLVTEQRFLDKLPQDGLRVICLDGEEQRVISKQSTENPVSGVTPDNLAYVIYTSGSTGKPKGVLVDHYNVVRLFEATDVWYDFNDKDVWTLFHSYAFDFSVWELWGALMYGGRLVVVPYDVSRSPEAFYELLVKEQVTVLNQTPSAFRQLIHAEETVGTAPDLALRYVIFGGEALELQSLRPWFERHGDQFPQLVNMYGITETTVHVTYRPISMEDLSKRGRCPNNGESSVIGVPIPDLQLYILDQNRQPVPIGVMGEMYVGGAGVAQGYLNRPELTEERFIAHPFSHKPNARLYKSGDLARYLPNQDIEYLGRIDHQVKIRGFRIELGEIEASLAQHEAVRDVAVIAQESPTGGKRLVAYLVLKQTVGKLRPNPTPTVSEWRTHIKKTLPDYMVPSAFVLMEQFPLTNNGKLDRRALPQPENERPDLRSDYAPPRSATERAIAEVWQSLLSVPKVGVHDNFFELGGDSLLAARAVGELRQRVNGDIQVYKLFEYPTVRTLADHLDAKQVQKASHMSVDVRAKKREAALKRRKKVVRRGRR